MEKKEEVRLQILKRIVELPIMEKTDWIQSYRVLYPERDFEADVIAYVEQNTEKPRSTFDNAMDSFLGNVKQAGNSFLDDIRLASEKIKVIEEPATKVIDKTLDVMSRVGSDLLNKAKVNYDKFHKNAVDMKFEDDLSKSFNEDTFVEAILSGKIQFIQTNHEKLDFFDHEGTQHKWTSGGDYFTLVVDEKNHVFFKINRIDYRQLMRKVEVHSLPRIYNVIVYGSDTTEVVDPTMKF